MYKHLFFMAMLAPVASATESQDLQINVQGVKPNAGPVVISVYKDGDTWLKKGKAVALRKLPATAELLTLQVTLPPGSYAVQAFQDHNNNDKLDMHWLPPGPDEPWVVSNNAQGSMGPPSFKDAKFEFPAQAKLTMLLQQP